MIVGPACRGSNGHANVRLTPRQVHFVRKASTLADMSAHTQLRDASEALLVFIAVQFMFSIPVMVNLWVWCTSHQRLKYQDSAWATFVFDAAAQACELVVATAQVLQVARQARQMGVRPICECLPSRLERTSDISRDHGSSCSSPVVHSKKVMFGSVSQFLRGALMGSMEPGTVMESGMEMEPGGGSAKWSVKLRKLSVRASLPPELRPGGCAPIGSEHTGTALSLFHQQYSTQL